MVRGALPLPRFRDLVRAKLDEARKLEASGVPRSEIRETLLRDATVVEHGLD